MKTTTILLLNHYLLNALKGCYFRGVVPGVPAKMDTAFQAVDTAIDRIKREVQIQKEKSDNMCRYKTAHNWQVMFLEKKLLYN